MIIRRLVAALRRQDWGTAVLDFLIVVAGIYMGLQAQDWSQVRSERAAERMIFEELRAALADDQHAYQTQLNRYYRIRDALEELIAHIDTGAPYHPDLDAKFGLFYGMNELVLNRAAYDSLKSQSLALIQRRKLRLEIIQYFDKIAVNAELASSQNEAGIIGSVLRPYVLRHFRDLRFSVSATPIDYPTLVQDPYLRNLIDYRRQAVLQDQIPKFEAAAHAADALTRAIDAELAGD